MTCAGRRQLEGQEQGCGGQPQGIDAAAACHLFCQIVCMTRRGCASAFLVSLAVPAPVGVPDDAALPAGVQWLDIWLPALVMVAKPDDLEAPSMSELLGNRSAIACEGCRLSNCLPQSQLHLLALSWYWHLASLTILVSCFKWFPCLPCLSLCSCFHCELVERHVHF